MTKVNTLSNNQLIPKALGDNSLSRFFRIINIINKLEKHPKNLKNADTAIHLHRLSAKNTSFIFRWYLDYRIEKVVTTALKNKFYDTTGKETKRFVNILSENTKLNEALRARYQKVLFTSFKTKWESDHQKAKRIYQNLTHTKSESANKLQEVYRSRVQMAKADKTVYFPKWYHATTKQGLKAILEDQSQKPTGEKGAPEYGAWLSSRPEQDYGNYFLVYSRAVEHPQTTGRNKRNLAYAWHGSPDPIALNQDRLVNIAVPKKSVENLQKIVDQSLPFKVRVISHDEMITEHKALGKGQLHPRVWNKVS